MRTSMLSIRRLALVAALLTLPVAGARAQVIETISNGLSSMVFEVDGPDLWIQSISDDTNLRVVSPLDGSGDFRMRLVATSEPEPGAGPTTNDPNRWFEIDANGLAAWNTVVWPTAPAVVTPNNIVHSVNGAQTWIDVVWSGTIDWTAAEPGAPLMDYEVVTRWSTLPGEDLPRATLRIELAESVLNGSDSGRGGRAGRSGGGDPAGSLPLLYASNVVHPIMKVPSFDDPGEALLIPNFGGSLIEDPTASQFPTIYSKAPNTFPINIGAFYGCDGALGCDDPTALVTWDDDFGGGWKTLLVATGTDGMGTDYVQLAWDHVPEDVFTTQQWTAPWDIRVGVTVGDWWDVAEKHRQALADSGVPWYSGPVASPANPRPQSVKDLAAEVFMVPGHLGDNMDIVSRQIMDMTRVLGPNVNVVMYGAYAPDLFDAWLGEGGYLEPGRPSFAAAVREGQRQFDHIVSPYVNGSTLTDYLEAGIPSTPDLISAHDAMLLQEDLSISHFGATGLGFMCSGHDWWYDWLIANVREIVGFTGARGVYLDYFLTGVCYSTGHGAGGPGVQGHEPGGGDWMLRLRSEQLAELRAQIGDDVALSIEFLMGRWADVADIMHVDIERSVMSTGNWLCCTGPSCVSYGSASACQTGCASECFQEPHPTGKTVPLFRSIHDDVKLSRITSAPLVSRADRLAWIEATHVFSFGQIPQITRSEFELWPVFGNRFSFAPYYGYFHPGADGDPAILPFDDDGKGSTMPIQPPKQGMDTANYQRFAASLASAVSGYDAETLWGLPPSTIDGADDFFNDTGFLGQGTVEEPFLEGLRKWHNGGLRRLPEYWATEIGAAGVVGHPDTIPSIEPSFGDGVYTSTPVYTELGFLDPNNLPVADPAFLRSFIPTGMFQAPFDLKGPAPHELEGLQPAGSTPGSGGVGPSVGTGHSPYNDGQAPEPASTLAGSLALVMSNPWIDRSLPGEFEVGFLFEPDRYPGWTETTAYSVTRYSVTGQSEVVTASHIGDFTYGGHTLKSGAIHWWIFRPLMALTP